MLEPHHLAQPGEHPFALTRHSRTSIFTRYDSRKAFPSLAAYRQWHGSLSNHLIIRRHRNPMISKYRNRALIGISIGLALFAFAIVLIVRGKRYSQMPNPQVFALVISIIGGVMAYLWGCFALAKAKGYDSGMVTGAIIITVFCAAGFTLLLPLVVLLVLEDKNRGHSRSRKRL